MNTRLDVLVILLDNGHTIESCPVFQAQVAEQFIAVGKLGYRIGVLCCYRDKDSFDELVRDQLESHDIIVLAQPDKGLAFNLLSFVRRLWSVRQTYHPRHAYVRGIWGAVALLLACPVFPLRYIFDVRGDLNDEGAARGASSWKIRIFQELESITLRRAHQVSAVTQGLADLVKARARLTKDITVVPSCVNPASFIGTPKPREERRKELGYSAGDVVLCYAGGLSHYQKVPEMLELWQKLARLDSSLRFLLITGQNPRELDSARGAIDDLGDRLQSMNLRHSEVANTLRAADIGFLLREDRKLNQTASPVKFAEYITCGLSVVSSPGIGDISRLILDSEIGVLVDPNDTAAGSLIAQQWINFARGQRDDVSSRAEQLARKNFHWSAHESAFRKYYGSPYTKHA